MLKKPLKSAPFFSVMSVLPYNKTSVFFCFMQAMAFGIKDKSNSIA